MFNSLALLLFQGVAVALFALISGCTPAPKVEAANQPDLAPIDTVCLCLEDVKQSGKLVALTDNSTTSYYIYRGTPMGYEYELLQLYAQYLNVELEVRLVDNLDSIFHQLLADSAHVVAANMTVTRKRAHTVQFTNPHMLVRQVLVQRLPENAHRYTLDKLNKTLIRNPTELAGKTIHVRKSSSFYPRLLALADEIGADIDIVPLSGDVETEELIAQVANGEIEFTVADEHVARLNKKYHPNIDVRTHISFPQQIAWAVQPCATDLLASLNHWIDSMKSTSDYNTIHTKYFKARTQQKFRVTSEFSSTGSGRISEYDGIIQAMADSIGYDWRLLASMIYHESHFDASAEVWTGATGLMQVLPSTAESYGIYDLHNPHENVRAGCLLLQELDNFWKERIEDENERIKFVLASYNVGLGHVLDARQLARKHETNPAVWEESVAKYLEAKAEPEFYNDPDVKHGYCRGSEPVEYVQRVLSRYEQYRLLF